MRPYRFEFRCVSDWDGRLVFCWWCDVAPILMCTVCGIVHSPHNNIHDVTSASVCLSVWVEINIWCWPLITPSHTDYDCLCFCIRMITPEGYAFYIIAAIWYYYNARAHVQQELIREWFQWVFVFFNWQTKYRYVVRLTLWSHYRNHTVRT